VYLTFVTNIFTRSTLTMTPAVGGEPPLPDGLGLGVYLVGRCNWNCVRRWLRFSSGLFPTRIHECVDF
jgi:hypothetical protein